MTDEREQSLVELVSTDGASIGSSTVETAHTGAGLLHRAFSVLLFDAQGRTLLQRRSAAKTRFPLRWANACCGHPAPGEAVVEAATRRLAEELGVGGVDLADVGVLTYAASDPATARIEHEYDHVLVGHVRSDLATSPDPDEVASLVWVDPSAVLGDVTGPRSAEYAPWLPGVLRIALAAAGRDSRAS
jgi:isopentenyl-diphosphate delta-isomerase